MPGPMELGENSETMLVGPHPLETDAEGRPVNTAACLILKDDNPLGKNLFVTSRPDHRAGAFKTAFLIAYSMGDGVEDPNRGLSNDRVPSSAQLDQLARLTLKRSKSPEEEGLVRRLDETAMKHGEKVIGNYVPVVMRGFGENVEVCVRKDPEVDLDTLDESVRVIEEDLGVPYDRVKVVSNSIEGNESLRRHYERRGSLYRLYPPTMSKDRQVEFIRESMIKTDQGVSLYYAAGSGERLLTEGGYRTVVEDFKGGRVDRETLAGQFHCMTDLYGRQNRTGTPSLSFCKVASGRFGIKYLRDVLESVEDSGKTDAEVVRVLQESLERMHDATENHFHEDNMDNEQWRWNMYKTLMGMEKAPSEELKLGLGREFMGEVEWLPGGRNEDDGFILDPHLDAMIEQGDVRAQHVKAIISDFRGYCGRKGHELEHINVGQVIESLSKRGKVSPEEVREVYVVEWRVEGDERNRVDLVRRQKWDERYYREGREFDFGDRKNFYGRVKLEEMMKAGEAGRDERGWYVERDGVKVYGRELTEGEAETLSREYTMFVLDRNRFDEVISPGHPHMEVIPCKEVEGDAEYDTPFLTRSYSEGVPVDKIPDEMYGNPEFVKRLAIYMGVEAARNMSLGRINPHTGFHLYGDGDEIIKLNEGGLPTGYIRNDETSVFGDVEKPLAEYVSTFNAWIVKTLDKAADRGVGLEDIGAIHEKYVDAFKREFIRIQKLFRDDGVRNMFDGNPPKRGEERYGWAGCRYLVPKAVDRVRVADVEELVGELNKGFRPVG